eukprot:481545_1
MVNNWRKSSLRQIFKFDGTSTTLSKQYYYIGLLTQVRAFHAASSKRKEKRRAALYHVKEYRYNHNEAVSDGGAIRMMNTEYKTTKLHQQYHDKYSILTHYAILRNHHQERMANMVRLARE